MQFLANFNIKNGGKIMKKLLDMNYEEKLQERKEIERYIISLIVRKNKKDIRIYEILRGENDRILSYSPYSANENTGLTISNVLRYRYSQLSTHLHQSFSDKRAKIQDKIEKIYGYRIQEKYVHIFLEEVFRDYDTYKKYCNRNKQKIIKLQKFNQICNLIKKWRKISIDMHYKMTLQEKRKLKKIFSENNK